MLPSIGRIVHYTLNEQDAEAINRRRTKEEIIRGRVTHPWPDGAQAHFGNHVSAGDVYPAIIARIWGNEESSAVNLQVFLDGNDVFWATSALQGDGQGQWRQPPKVG